MKGRCNAPGRFGRKFTYLPPCLLGIHSRPKTPVSTVFGKEPRLLCDLLLGEPPPPPDKEQPTLDHAANLLHDLHDIHNYARQHLKLASDRMKTRYDWATACLLPASCWFLA
jgi:hypothetical protein